MQLALGHFTVTYAWWFEVKRRDGEMPSQFSGAESFSHNTYIAVTQYVSSQLLEILNIQWAL